jgi:hypothetical protein
VAKAQRKSNTAHGTIGYDDDPVAVLVERQLASALI